MGGGGSSTPLWILPGGALKAYEKCTYLITGNVRMRRNVSTGVSVTQLLGADYVLSVFPASGTEYGADSPLEMLNALQSSRVKV